MSMHANVYYVFVIFYILTAKWISVESHHVIDEIGTLPVEMLVSHMYSTCLLLQVASRLLYNQNVVR